jgi:hypothetical protein
MLVDIEDQAAGSARLSLKRAYSLSVAEDPWMGFMDVPWHEMTMPVFV